MICDIVLHTRFEDEYRLEDVCFLDFIDRDSRKAESGKFTVSIPDKVLMTMDSATLVVKKSFCNGKLTSFSPDQFSDIAEVTEDGIQNLLSCGISPQKHIEEINKLTSPEEVLDYIQSNAGNFTQKDQIQLEEAAEANKANINNAKKAVRNILVDIINREGGTEAEVLNSHDIRCPICGEIQRSGRKACFKCGVQFFNL